MLVVVVVDGDPLCISTTEISQEPFEEPEYKFSSGVTDTPREKSLQGVVLSKGPGTLGAGSAVPNILIGTHGILIPSPCLKVCWYRLTVTYCGSRHFFFFPLCWRLRHISMYGLGVFCSLFRTSSAWFASSWDFRPWCKHRKQWVTGMF